MAIIKMNNCEAFAMVDDEDYADVARYTWWRSLRGYPERNYSRKERKQQGRIQMGRHILGLKYGDSLEVDHINRNPFDNRRCNLRIVEKGQNQQNRRHKGGSSPFRGVTWHRGVSKWQASAKLKGKNYYLGLFTSELEAAEVARDFRTKHMPFAVEYM